MKNRGLIGICIMLKRVKYGHVAGWIPTGHSVIVEQDVDEAVESEKLKKLRESILDGSFRYCDRQKCKYLANDMLPNLTEEEIAEITSQRYPDVFNPANPFYREVIDILDDPIMKDPRVWHWKWIVRIMERWGNIVWILDSNKVGFRTNDVLVYQDDNHPNWKDIDIIVNTIDYFDEEVRCSLKKAGYSGKILLLKSLV